MHYQFDGGSLDGVRRELRQGGRLVAVEPQVFDLLDFLIRQRDRVVSRDDLIEAVWGGRIVSESTLATRINAARKAIGDDGASQRLIKTIARKGFRFVGEVRESPAGETSAAARGSDLAQSISFCRTSDNVAIAVATVGKGPPLIKTSNWLNHLEHDWESPIWSPFLRRLAGRFRLVRYDGRGNGLSDRDVADISQAAFERDLEAVVESAGMERFALLALSQGVASAVAFAARHPERVSCMILYGAYVKGRNLRSPDDVATAQTMLAMMQQGWGQADSAFMRAFSSLYLSDASRTHIKSFAEMQRLSASGDMAARLRVACDDIDVTDLLPQIRVPTLVIHARHDNVAPYEQGRLLATLIPGARLFTLESENHIPVPDDPAWQRLLEEIESFAARAGSAAS